MISIEVYGVVRPGGSKTPGRNKKTGKLYVRDANPNTAIWRDQVSSQAKKQYSGPLLSLAVEMLYVFRFERPKWHFGTGKNSKVLKASAPCWHSIKPDLTKIIRSTEDALTGITYTDDCLVAKRMEEKRYCNGDERPGVSITIWEV